MHPNKQVIFKDYFTGKELSTERYLIAAALGTAEHVAGGFGAEGGALKLGSDDGVGDWARLTTITPYQFTLSQEAVLEARFRLISDDGCAGQIGFYQDTSNYIILEMSTTLDGGGIALHADRAGSHTYDYSPMTMDAAWHTMQLRLLGTGNGVECVLDGDEANKMEIANGNIPAGDGYGAYLRSLTRAILRSGDERGMYLDYWNVTQWPRYITPV